jgi:hypothetical protein
MIDISGESRGSQPRAASKVDRALEERGLPGNRMDPQHSLEKNGRAAIAEFADQRGFEPRRILIEQRLHIGLRHAGQRRCAEPHQPQTCAVAITGIAGLRRAERFDGCGVFAELFAEFAEREPGRGEIRRQFDRLQEQVRSGGQIALHLQVAREFEPAVGHQIAGGEKQSRGHGFQFDG